MEWEFTWNVFKEFLKEIFIQVRPEILNLIPKTAYFFNGSFIKLVSINNGGIFSSIPNEFRDKVIEICIFAGQVEVNPLIDFVEVMGNKMLKYCHELKGSDFISLLDEIINTLKKRSQLWINKIDMLSTNLQDAIKLFIDKKIKSFKEVSKFLEGDNEKLNEAFKQEVILETESINDQAMILEKFKLLNHLNKGIQDFEMFPVEKEVCRKMG